MIAEAMLAPDVAALLTALAASPALSFREMSLAEARAVPAMIAATFDLSGDPAVVAQDMSIAAEDGRVIPARAYSPAQGKAGPVAVFYHGGGWVVGDLDSSDSFCRHLAASLGWRVVSVAYRLAPEHQFPAAYDDALAAARAVAAEAAEGIVLIGDSAGGGLAAAVGLALAGPDNPARAQLLFYPVLDLSRRSPSYQQYGRGFLLEATDMDYFIDCYVPKATDRTDPRCSPLLSDRLADVAPVVLVSCDHDVLHDEGLAFASACRAAGARVETIAAAGQIHGIIGLRKALPTAVPIIASAIERLRSIAG